MNEMSSTFQGVSAVPPAPASKYLWTADGWIRGIRRPPSGGEQDADIGDRPGVDFLRHEQKHEA
ncbi:MAG: hypothetical protein ACHQ2Z_17070 [Elusimicrobiota bacterium]